MKIKAEKYLLFVLFLSGIVPLWGQMPFTLQPVPAEGGGSAGEDEILVHAMIRNLTDSTIVIAWERSLEDMPENWETYVCSNITCAPPNVVHGTFSLTAGDSTNLDCYFLPDGVGAFATVNLRLFYLDDTTQTLTGVYLCNATAVAVNETEQHEIRVFPNPAKEVLHVEAGRGISKIELRNVQGSKLLEQQGGVFSVSLKSFPAGIYLLYLKDDQGIPIDIHLISKID